MKTILLLSMIASISGCVSLSHHQLKLEQERLRSSVKVLEIIREDEKEIARLEEMLKGCTEARALWMDRATEKR